MDNSGKIGFYFVFYIFWNYTLWQVGHIDTVLACFQGNPREFIARTNEVLVPDGFLSVLSNS